uniref:Protein-tyrosine-phosphatase n=1 Tax=Hymenolepis diminuta TaxID=6216 RepID=A0A158QG19_HYMDI
LYFFRNLPSKDNPEESGLRVICNDSDRLTVIWPDPPKVEHGYYTVEIEGMKKISCTQKPIESEFINLQPFTKYTVNIYDYYDTSHKYRLGSVFAHTIPEVPDPAEFVNCTSSEIVVKLKRKQDEDPKDYYYTSKVRKYYLESGNVKEVENVQCDQSNGECKFENLLPYTPYVFTLRKCSAKEPILCSRESKASGVFYTLPKSSEVTPKDMKITSRSVSVSNDNEMRNLAYSTIVLPAGTNPSEGSEIPCGRKCTVNGLLPNTAYEISLRVCLMQSGRRQCGNWSSPYKFYTNPDVPSDITVINYTASSLSVAWKAPALNTELLTSYKIIMTESEKTVKTVDVPTAILHWTVNDLKPFTLYWIRVSACARNSQCGDFVSTYATTAPEEPANVTISESSENSFLVKWQPPKRNSEEITHYKIQMDPESVLYFSGAKTEAMIKDLKPTTMYRVNVFACSRENDCGLGEVTTVWTTPRQPSGLRLMPLKNGTLFCEWNEHSKDDRISYYKVDFQEVNEPLRTKSHNLTEESHFLEYKNPKSHMEYLVKLRACFQYGDSKKFLCSLPSTAQAITKPRTPEFTVIERTPSSIAFQLNGPVDVLHFNYTLQVVNRSSEVIFNSQTNIFNATLLPANSKITASLVTCCKHNLCGSPFNKFAFTKPAVPLNLQIGKATDQTLLVSWKRPENNEEPIHNYKVRTEDARGHVHKCLPPNPNPTRINCIFRNLPPCQPYNISVETCARENDCGPATIKQGFTLPEAVKELRINQLSSTWANFNWSSQDLEVCVLANITVIVQEQSTFNVVGNCFVLISDNIVNECTIRNLTPNTEYIAFAVACSKTVLNCATKSENVEFTTLPGVPQNFQVVKITSQSAEFKWNRSSGRQDGLNGYLMRIYETSGDGQSVRKVPISNYSISAVNGLKTFKVDNLEPSKNYFATIAAFRASSIDSKTFGDESEKMYFKTSPPFPIAAVILSLLVLLLLLLIILAIVFRQRIYRINRGIFHKQDEFDVPKPYIHFAILLLFNTINICCLMSSFLSRDSFSIEYSRPSSLQYLLQIPPPVTLEKFDTCVASLNANKQFVPHFMLLRQISLNGLEKEFRLTRKAGVICKERNRYVDMLPYDQSLLLLGRPWPFVLDNPKTIITTTDILNDYVNASYIRPPIYGSEGEALPCDPLEVPEFIATQAPLESTTFDFLTMVYEQRSKLIIMLCRYVQNAGVGRTGTFITACYLLGRLRADPSTIDVCGTILAIRRWRPNLVQVWQSSNRVAENWITGRNHFWYAMNGKYLEEAINNGTGCDMTSG